MPTSIFTSSSQPAPRSTGRILDRPLHRRARRRREPGMQDIERRQQGSRALDAAPNGTYTVRLDYYNSCNAAVTNYTVSITDGKTTLAAVTGQFNGIGDVGNSATTVRIFTRNGSSLARLTPRRLLQSASVLAIFSRAVDGACLGCRDRTA